MKVPELSSSGNVCTGSVYACGIKVRGDEYLTLDIPRRRHVCSPVIFGIFRLHSLEPENCINGSQHEYCSADDT